MSSRTHVLLVFCLVASLALQAQVYPVQGNLVLNPPYSPYLSDLTAIGSQRLWLNLRLQDPTISTFPCKLRLTIEGVGITLRTKNTFIPPPITLEGGGIPQLFYGDDVAAYFNPANLDFAGLSRAQYERTQSLPEGVYRFSIEVLDYNRGTVVSNKISTTAWIVLNQPPLLNLPRHDNKITILEPSNIVFSWTPRHTGSPNSAFTTEYTFRLIELAPNASTQSANAAFLSQPVLYERTLTQNQLVYGPAEPALLAGRKYAWQIEASDTEGRDLFRNHGKSEVFVFQYGDAMGVPRNVVQQGGNSSTLSLQWELPTEGEMPIQYRIRYKPFTSTTDNYFESVTPNRFYTIGELIPATTYLVQVRAERNSIFSEYSTPLQMSTTSIEDRPYTCGQAPVLTPPGSTEILQHLFPGDEITMHDFRVRVLTVEGSNGNFNGTGLMPVSLFNNASVKVRYSGRVNKDYELAGEIVSLPRKNSAMGRLVDEMEKIGADRKTAQDKADSMANPTPVAIAITGIIDSVWVQDSVIVVQREDGTQQEIARPQTQEGTMQQVVLTDSVGNSYTVNEAGEVISNGSSATSRVASSVHYQMNFSAKEDQYYGFDAKQHAVLNHYETDQIEEESYTIPWKSIETGRFDKVKVSSSISRTDLLREVGFSAESTALPKQAGDHANELIVTVQGKNHEQVEQVSAYLERENADSSRLEVGKLNVITYNKAYRRLVLVSVNGAQLSITPDALETELNKIYKQAVVEWIVDPVETMNDVVYDINNNGLEYGNSAWYTNYTGEMRTIINSYLRNESLLTDTYYLFIVPKTDDAKVMGYMPRKKQMGFICSEKVNASNTTKTIAHELAHGAFRLEHSFPLLPEQGDNLMDYSADGTTLYKTQWDYIHNPVAMLALFDEDEEGAMVTNLSGLTALINNDTLTADKIFVITGNSFKLDAKHNVANVGEVSFRLTIKPEGGGADVLHPSDDWKKVNNNESWVLDLNSVTEGKYILSYKVGTTTTTADFYVRVVAHDYACSICGRDLKLTQTTLKNIFPNSELIDSDPNVLNYFNEALKNGGFKTCHRQAHFFSQVYEESGGMTADVEKSEYSVKRMLEIYKGNSNTKTVFFKQAFWDQKDYMDYASLNLYEGSTDTTITKYEGKDLQTFKWSTTTTSDTIKIPTTFSPKKTSEFKKTILTDAQKTANGQNLFNLVYANKNGNGDIASGDGYKFRGRGAIQLTGRTTYREVSNKCNSTFSTTYNWESNPEVLETENKAVIYSVAAFFIWKFGDLQNLDTKDVTAVTKKVNGGTHGLSTRSAKFSEYLNGRLNNCKPKK